MDIILNTTFNNPRLPVVPLLGFLDDFNRPGALGLGHTADNKPWEYSGSLAWSITENQTAASLGGSMFAVAEGNTPNGTLMAVVAKAPSDNDYRAGLALRVKDAGNMLWVSPNTAGSLTFYGRLEGSTTINEPIGGGLADGDVLSVEMSGSNFTVKLNGDTVHTTTVPIHAEETRHGLMAFSSRVDAEWDSIEFIP